MQNTPGCWEEGCQTLNGFLRHLQFLFGVVYQLIFLVLQLSGWTVLDLEAASIYASYFCILPRLCLLVDVFKVIHTHAAYSFTYIHFCVQVTGESIWWLVSWFHDLSFFEYMICFKELSYQRLFPVPCKSRKVIGTHYYCCWENRN